MRGKPILIAALVVAAALVPVAAAAPPAASSVQQADGYSGTFVSFETTSNSVVDYAVDGQTVFDSIAVQSKSSADGGIGVDAGLEARTSLDAAALSLGTQTSTRASVESNSGARIQAYDCERGILVVEAGSNAQYVTVNLSSDAEATQESDQKVVVTHGDGGEGAFLVVGDGEVTVNDQGNVSSEVGTDGRLVYRNYADGRSDDDKQQEEFITSGKAAAEVFVTKDGDSGDDGQDRASDVVTYNQDTTVEVVESTEGRLEMTAERSASEGRIIITSVSEEAFGSAQNLNVTVDGEAAAEASSYSDLEAAAEGGDNSAYLVRQSSAAQANADVLVAVNEFSERSVTMTSAGGGDGGFGTSQPGFGIVVGLLALTAGLLAKRRY